MLSIILIVGVAAIIFEGGFWYLAHPLPAPPPNERDPMYVSTMLNAKKGHDNEYPFHLNLLCQQMNISINVNKQESDCTHWLSWYAKKIWIFVYPQETPDTHYCSLCKTAICYSSQADDKHGYMYMLNSAALYHLTEVHVSYCSLGSQVSIETYDIW